MQCAEILRWVDRLEAEITSRFYIRPNYTRLEAREPNFATIGPLGTVQNLQYVLWYCEQIKQRAKNMRAQNWEHIAPQIRLWFAFACGLAAAEGMLPDDQALLTLLDATNQPLSVAA